jgi:hypothetical protein
MKPFKTNDFHILKQVLDSRRFYSFLNLNKIQISLFLNKFDTLDLHSSMSLAV